MMVKAIWITKRGYNFTVAPRASLSRLNLNMVNINNGYSDDRKGAYAFTERWVALSCFSGFVKRV